MGLLINYFKEIMTPNIAIILIIILFTLYSKNKKIEYAQKEICGDRVSSTFELTLSQFIFGVIGGIAGSYILKVLKIDFKNEIAIQTLVIISIGLSFIKSKYICFSYSGAIYGLFNICFNDGNTSLNSKSIILFVAVLHIIEGLLIAIDGDKGALPILKEDENGNVIGGYSFKRYWVIFILIMSNSYLYTILFAVIGYSTKTFTRDKKEKTLVYGMIVSIYGLIILMISKVCDFGVLSEMVSLILMAVLHEIMLYVQRKIEESKDYKFISDDEGLIILEISKNSILRKYNIKAGSKILKINNKSINSKEDIDEILKNSGFYLRIEFLDNRGIYNDVKIKLDKPYSLDFMIVPNNMVNIQKESFGSILNKINSNNI